MDDGTCEKCREAGEVCEGVNIQYTVLACLDHGACFLGTFGAEQWKCAQVIESYFRLPKAYETANSSVHTLSNSLLDSFFHNLVPTQPAGSTPRDFAEVNV